MPSNINKKYRLRYSKSLPPINITARDLDILRLVTRHRFLTSFHIEKLIEGSNKHLRERLKLLTWHGYLDRPEETIIRRRNEGGSYPYVYALAAKGARLLIETDGIESLPTGATKYKNSARRPYIEHTLNISDFATSLFAANDNQSDLDFSDMDTLIADLPEKRRGQTQPFSWNVKVTYKGRHHKLGLSPDYAFSLKTQSSKSPHFYMVECDRGTMPVRRYGDDPFERTSIFKKLMGYQDGWNQNYHQYHFNWPNFRVLIITDSEVRADHMRSCLRDMTYGKGSPLFWFTHREIIKPDYASGSILDHVWIDGRGKEQTLSI